MVFRYNCICGIRGQNLCVALSLFFISLNSTLSHSLFQSTNLYFTSQTYYLYSWKAPKYHSWLHDLAYGPCQGSITLRY